MHPCPMTKKGPEGDVGRGSQGGGRTSGTPRLKENRPHHSAGMFPALRPIDLSFRRNMPGTASKNSYDKTFPCCATVRHVWTTTKVAHHHQHDRPHVTIPVEVGGGRIGGPRASSGRGGCNTGMQVYNEGHTSDKRQNYARPGSSVLLMSSAVHTEGGFLHIFSALVSSQSIMPLKTGLARGVNNAYKRVLHQSWRKTKRNGGAWSPCPSVSSCCEG